METYNATSVLMTMNLMPDLINNLKFAKGEEKILTEIWHTVLRSTLVKCQDKRTKSSMIPPVKIIKQYRLWKSKNAASLVSF